MLIPNRPSGEPRGLWAYEFMLGNHTKPNARQTGVEIADCAERPSGGVDWPDMGVGSIIVGPPHEAAVEGITQAGGAMARIGGVEVLAANSEVIFQVLAPAHVRDRNPGARGPTYRGTIVDGQAEHAP